MKHQELICDFGILRELRKRENMSIAELSEQSGVSASVISKLERNQNTAEMDTLYRIARVFGLTLSDLISLAENKTSHCVEAETLQVRRFRFRPCQLRQHALYARIREERRKTLFA